MQEISGFFLPIFFSIIIIIQIFERQALLERESKEKKDLHEQNAKLQAALIAKSANEYTMMRTMDKVVEKEPENPPGAVDMSELDDETYDKMIKSQIQNGN